jgi:hypothetical protein
MKKLKILKINVLGKKMKLKNAILIVPLFATIACTPRPESIAPVSMTGAFNAVSCRDARNQLETERQTLGKLEKQQNSAATADAVGVFLVLVPISKVTGGDKAGEIGASKGKVLALEQRLQTCT